MGKWRNFGLAMVGVLMLAGAAAVQAGEVTEDIQAKFLRANELMRQKKFAEALPLLRELSVKVPDGPGIFGNLAIVATELGNHQLALDARLRYLQLRPNEPAEMGGVMLSYQALGRLKERDAQRDRIFALWASMPAAEKAKVKGYVRDQFNAGGLHFVVTEFFEPLAPVNRFYQFDAQDVARRTVYFFGLESGDATTNVARDLGNIGKTERIYSLDKYQDKTHSTYGLMKSRPSYDTVRGMVISAAEGRLPATSSSTR